MSYESISKTDAWEFFLPGFEGLSLNFHGRIFIATWNGAATARNLEVKVTNTANQRIDFDVELEFSNGYSFGVTLENGGTSVSKSVNAGDEETFYCRNFGRTCLLRGCIYKSS
eukprot:TRINITY_DN9275_c0_g1_i1.p1 TRINITY_DN9275_c0_g1~~TRINITY_DN9275_c0_g1_i1.p1  ORF type:complete len:113 (+),score=11.39 TRINITY_DN9275_c0_g1_i1:225-563(+)